MKTVQRGLWAGLVLLALGSFGLASARAGVLYVGNASTQRIETRDASTGALLNANFISGVSNPWGMTVSGNTLYVADLNTAFRAYDATTGTLLNTFSSTRWVSDVAVSGNTLYMANYGTRAVDTYNATTWASITTGFTAAAPLGSGFQTITVTEGHLFAALNRGWVSQSDATSGGAATTFISGLTSPEFVRSAGNTLYVSGNNRVGAYNATTGAALNATFISQTGAVGMDVSGGVLYVSSPDSSTTGVRAYDAVTGLALAGFTPITGNSYRGLAVGVVPEPGSLGLLALAVIGLAGTRARRRRSA